MVRDLPALPSDVDRLVVLTPDQLADATLVSGPDEALALLLQLEATCSIDGCGREVQSLGWCNRHYLRAYRHGDPLAGGTERFADPNDPARFWPLVDVGHPLGCWAWTGSVSPEGYGRLNNEYAHRLAYERLRGAIPSGMTLDHLCRNRRCVNPDHLEPTTNRENILRGESPSARNARSSTCSRGHTWSEENTYRRPDTGTRMCRACQRRRAGDRLHHAECTDG